MSDPQTARYCANCRWMLRLPVSIYDPRPPGLWCRNVASVGIDVVTGGPFDIECYKARKDGSDCGPNGDLFEAKTETDEERETMRFIVGAPVLLIVASAAGLGLFFLILHNFVR